MRYFILLIFISFICSCQSSTTDSTAFVATWTNDIKKKIIEDANQVSDRTTLDSVTYSIILYKGNIKLKQFMLRPVYKPRIAIPISLDTLVSIFYSFDQKFELVRELCPAVSRSFEGLRYSGVGSLGLIEFRYCDGRIKERGFRYKNAIVGVWTKYDSTGKVIEQKDHGNTSVLNNLHDIKYYR